MIRLLHHAKSVKMETGEHMLVAGYEYATLTMTCTSYDD